MSIPPPDPHRVSKNFFTLCCKSHCISTLSITLWKISVRIYLLFTCCFSIEKIKESIKVPTYFSPEDQKICQDFLDII